MLAPITSTVDGQRLTQDPVLFSQKQRDVTLDNFKKGKFRVLVATDVAARGIDISGIDLVIQIALPQNSDSYVHRAGRTGRAGNTGTSIIMHTAREVEDACLSAHPSSSAVA